MFYCHLSAFSRQTVYNKIISSWQYPLIIRLTIAIVHSIVSRIILLFQLDYLIKSPFVSMLGGQRKHSGRGVEGMLCLCHPFGMLVPRLWHDCAIAVAQLCQALCTIVSEVWHNRFRRWHNRPDSLSQTVWILERETTKGKVLVTVWNEGSSPVHAKEESLPPCSRLNDIADRFSLVFVWMTESNDGKKCINTL